MTYRDEMAFERWAAGEAQKAEDVELNAINQQPTSEVEHLYFARYGEFRFICSKTRCYVGCRPFFSGDEGVQRFKYCPICGQKLTKMKEDINMEIDYGD